MDDLITRGPQDATELLQWLDPARWKPRPVQSIWDQMVQALGAAGWYGLTLEQLVQNPEHQQELQRIRAFWAAQGLPMPW